MLLREAEAAFGEEGGEVLLMTQGGDGERDGERPRVGLLFGLCRGEKAWSIRPLRSWNICFCKSKVKRCSLSSAQRRLWAGRGCTVPLTPGSESGGRALEHGWFASAVLMIDNLVLACKFLPQLGHLLCENTLCTGPIHTGETSFVFFCTRSSASCLKRSTFLLPMAFSF